jgi:hypothetical protein
VSLGWTLPTRPPATRMLLQAISGATVRSFFTVSCSSKAPCPTAYTFSGLTTGTRYTFAVYTGSADDALVVYPADRYAIASRSYSGAATIEGGSFQVCTTLVKINWW